MLSEEEKKAIELLKDFKRELNNIESYERADVEGKYKKILIVLQEDDFDTFQTILNLIDKRQKEIEEKNCLIDVLQHKIEELLDNKKEINYIKPIDIKVQNYISKDKIRELIEKYEQDYKRQDKEELFNLTKITAGKLSALNELLEEN